MKKTLILCLVLMSVTSFSFEDSFVRNEGTANVVYNQQTNTVIALTHYWWETGNYTADAVARFRAEDAARYERYKDRTDAWGVLHALPKYAGITTNTAHWMRSHRAPTTEETPYLTFTGWHRYGWIRLFWRESLTTGDWLEIASTGTQHTGVHNFKVYFHPKSETTQKILSADTGFFRMSDGFYTSTWNKTKYPTSRIFKIDVSGLFKIVPNTNSIIQIESISTSSPMIPGA